MIGLKSLPKGEQEFHVFIVNDKNATGEDIHSLILLVHDEVLDKYGVDLKVEQEFVNWE